MNKIEWLTKSKAMYEAYHYGLKNHLRGGRLYELLAMEVLASQYDVSINKALIKETNILTYALQSHQSKIGGDVCVVDPYIVALGKFHPKKQNVAVIHHINFELFNKNIWGKWFFFNLKRNLKKMDAVVVVSEVWKSILMDMGVQNIKVIYNAFKVDKYMFSDEEKALFKEKYKIKTEKPIIYLGPNSTGKGIEEILEVIDVDKYQLLSTGKHKVNHPSVNTFFFSEEEFPLFLSCCDVVLCMSTMTEGWNRIAHEALLAKTVVIGSGTGGMQELLEKSGQIILTDIKQLNEKIELCLDQSQRYIDMGYQYVSQFDLDYFKSSWLTLINDVSL